MTRRELFPHSPPGFPNLKPLAAAMPHTPMSPLAQSMRLIPYQRDDHAVEVEEEHQEVEAEFHEGFLEHSYVVSCRSLFTTTRTE